MNSVEKDYLKEVVERIQPEMSDEFVKRIVLSHIRDGVPKSDVTDALRVAVALHRRKAGRLTSVPRVQMPATIHMLGGGPVKTQRGPWKESIRMAVGRRRWDQQEAKKSLSEVTLHYYQYWQHRAEIGGRRAFDPAARREWLAAGGDLPEFRH